MRFFNLATWIVLATVAGLGVGIWAPEWTPHLKPIGDIFLSLVRMLVVPLVFFSILHGAAQMADSNSLGRMSAITLSFFALTTVIAATVGIVAAEMFQIGAGITVPQAELPAFSMPDAAQTQQESRGVWGFILDAIPVNLMQSLLDGDMLPIIFFAVFFGLGIPQVTESFRDLLRGSIEGASEVLMWMINRVMLLAPLGVFALMSVASASFGWELLYRMLKFLMVNLVTCVLFAVGILGLVVQLAFRVSLLTFFRKLSPAMFMAFASASSLATLPMTHKCCRSMGCSERSASFVLPLGATVNMNGTALFYCMATVFFAQMYQVPLGLSEYAIIVLTSSIAAVGVAGVSGLVFLILPVLTSVGIPIDALPILIGIDRIFDMMRTTLNITGDAACAMVLDATQRPADASNTRSKLDNVPT